MPQVTKAQEFYRLRLGTHSFSGSLTRHGILLSGRAFRSQDLGCVLLHDAIIAGRGRYSGSRTPITSSIHVAENDMTEATAEVWICKQTAEQTHIPLGGLTEGAIAQLAAAFGLKDQRSENAAASIANSATAAASGSTAFFATPAYQGLCQWWESHARLGYKIIAAAEPEAKNRLFNRLLAQLHLDPARAEAAL